MFNKKVAVAIGSLVIVMAIMGGLLASNYQTVNSLQKQLTETQANNTALTAQIGSLQSSLNNLQSQLNQINQTPTIISSNIQDKISIQAISYSNGNITIYAQNIGETTPTLDKMIIKDPAGNTITSLSVSNPSWGNGALVLIHNDIPFMLTPGQSYTVTLTTVLGNNFISPVFVASS
jgi:TolA-binding protein